MTSNFTMHTAQWKYRGIGPNVHKVGRHLRYRWTEVDAWVNAQTAYDLTA
ncbi:DNA-binding protein [Streptomyces sp. GXMU-J5]|uniref:DNA-binding protein n=1 Tax=Streptomyces beihaiensis TaxID=2984495 RepID=A0ABT3TXD5_9ACTN|nr:DNA-binding protein [Streptomyces beihaiensis]